MALRIKDIDLSGHPIAVGDANCSGGLRHHKRNTLTRFCEAVGLNLDPQVEGGEPGIDGNRAVVGSSLPRAATHPVLEGVGVVVRRRGAAGTTQTDIDSGGAGQRLVKRIVGDRVVVDDRRRCDCAFINRRVI